MPWYEPFKHVVDAINYEYDRRIRAASNVKEYHPEGGGHGHGGHVLAHDDATMPEEEGGGSGTVGALQGAAGPQYTVVDAASEEIAQH